MPSRPCARVAVRATAIAGLLLGAACGASSTSTLLPVGGACGGSNALCASGMCLQVDTETSLCTKSCATNSNCPTDYLCTAVPDKGSVCLPLGLDGNCESDTDCSAGFVCDTTADVCYIPVVRTICSPCTSSKQCPTGAGGESGFCRADGKDQTCTAPCTGGSCPTGYICQSVTGATGMQCVPNNTGNTCNAGEGLCGACVSDDECGGAEDYCVRNLASNEMFCGTSCKVTTDCPANFNCTDLSGTGAGPDVCVPNSGTCAGYCDSTAAADVRRECGEAATCDLSTFSCVQKTDGTLCAACVTDQNCVTPNPTADPVCLENQCTNCPFMGQKFCSVPCTAASGASPCPTGFTCIAVGTGSSAPMYCVPDSESCQTGAGAVGDDCTALGAAACLSGICVSLGSQSVCSSTCMTASDCGQANFICCALNSNGTDFDCNQMPGANGGVCAPIGGGFGADCSPGQPPCYNGVCLDLGTASLCTSSCSASVTCPMGFSCRQGEQSNGDGTFSMVSVCFPSGGGGVGADCTFGPAACQSGECLKKDTGNICTQTCTSTSSCPTGYVCDPEALSTNSMMTQEVCVPAVP